MDKPLFQEVLRMVLPQPVDASDAVKKTWTEGLGALDLQAPVPAGMLPVVSLVLSWSGKMLPCGF